MSNLISLNEIHSAKIPYRTLVFRFVIKLVAITTSLCVYLLALQPSVCAQIPHCDPGKVLGVNSCSQCHNAELLVWKQTPHAQTFEALHRNPRAKEISKNLGQRSIKRGNRCIKCHYTTQQLNDDRERVIAGVSCESCHGAASDWIHLHNDYGGPTATRQAESPTHRQHRLEESLAAGMRNSRNLYLIAQSCLQCHSVPDEELVNTGTHVAGSDNFELVAWSQGTLRHNFLQSQGTVNATRPLPRIRVMYVVGQIADLEFNTRATALATEKAIFGTTVANRAATTAARLFEIEQRLHHPLLESILQTFSKAELKTNNPIQLIEIADTIQELGIEFSEKADGKTMGAIDSMLPNSQQYR